MNFKNFLIIIFILSLSACSANTDSEYTVVTVKEVEQVSGYTYLMVKGKGPAYWIAVPSMEASPGQKYHYKEGMLMKDFHSKDLDRTFDEVYFVETLLAGKPAAKAKAKAKEEMEEVQEVTPGSKVTAEKADIKVETAEGTISISELFSEPAKYEGKAVKVRGEVTKFNAAIMERNWVHIQDGTEFEGKFDLTATSIENFEVGSVVTIEGIVALDLDFGYGYTYEILLEKQQR